MRSQAASTDPPIAKDLAVNEAIFQLITVVAAFAANSQRCFC
jgi:hypothetical protein